MAKVSKICKKYAKISEKVSNFLNSEEKQPHRLSYIKKSLCSQGRKVVKAEHLDGQKHHQNLQKRRQSHEQENVQNLQ